MAPGVLQVGEIDHPDITESSGLVASRNFPGVFWTHNDKGNVPTLFAITQQGRLVGEHRIAGTALRDWEDLAIDDFGNLFLADIGNNDARRRIIAVHQVREPHPAFPTVVPVQQTWRLRFPHDPVDCEAFFICKGFGYLVAKEVSASGAALFRFPLTSAARFQVLQPLTPIRVSAPVTGADISRDLRRLALITDSGAFLFPIEGDVLRMRRVVPWFTSFDHDQMEGGCFAGTGFLVSTEQREMFLFNDALFRTR